MNTLIEKLELQARENPKETILFDETVTKGITYEDLHELSGKVYAWLKYQGIGREDFILINLARRASGCRYNRYFESRRSVRIG